MSTDEDQMIDSRFLSPEAIRHNTQRAQLLTNEHGGFTIVRGALLFYIDTLALVTCWEPTGDNEVLVHLLNADGLTEIVRMTALKALYDSAEHYVFFAEDDVRGYTSFFKATGMRNEPPPTKDEATDQRATLRKLLAMIGHPSNHDWSELQNDDIIPIAFEITVADLKEARRIGLGEKID